MTRHQQSNFPSLWATLQKRSHALLAGLTVVTGVMLMGGMPAIAQTKDAPTQQLLPSGASSLPDGTYLYGQAPQPDQIGQGYFVFEVTRGQVVGALYMPHSSFDCAFGRFQEKELKLTVVNSYDRATNPFQIAVENNATIANQNGGGVQIGLEGFHRLPQITENDSRMLNVCKQDLQRKN